MKDSTWLWIAIGGALLLTGGVAAISLGTLNASQIMQYASNAGFYGSDLIKAVAVALAESSGNPQALGDLSVGGSYGLWQINAHYHPEYGPNFEQLYDPQINANAAYAIYQAAGNSFTPWTTFKTGAYLTYMTAASNA